MSGIEDLPVLAVRNVPITIGDLKGALEALPTLQAAIRDALLGAPTWSDAETLGEDALAAVATVDPSATAFVAIARIALTLAPLAFAAMKPDPDPIRDAQTTEGRGGRRDG